MIGPALGGWLIAAWGGRPGYAFLINAITFLGLDRLRVLHEGACDRGSSAEGRASAFHDIREGFRFVRSRVWLWGTFLAATLAYLIFWGPSEVLLPFIVKNHMHGTARDLGFILALGGVGAMFAAIVMGNRDMPRRHITFMYVVWTASTVAIAGYGLASFPWQLMVASFVFNALEGAGTIVWATTKGRLVPAQAPRAGVQLRLVHLDGSRARVLRSHRSRGGDLRRPDDPRRRRRAGRHRHPGVPVHPGDARCRTHRCPREGDERGRAALAIPITAPLDGPMIPAAFAEPVAAVPAAPAAPGSPPDAGA